LDGKDSNLDLKENKRKKRERIERDGEKGRDSQMLDRQR
jgi:hypothetical protein